MLTGDDLRTINIEKLDVGYLARLAGVLDAVTDESVQKVVIHLRDGRCIGCGRNEEGRLLPVAGVPEALAHSACADRIHDKLAALLELSKRTVAAFDRTAGVR